MAHLEHNNQSQCSIKQHQHHNHLEFENSLRIIHPKNSNRSLYRVYLFECAPAILRETSEETSYQMVRLVLRPYTKIRRSICTSEPLRTSTRVSSGFVLFRHSSPSFGSHSIRSTSASGQVLETGQRCLGRTNAAPSHVQTSNVSLSLRL